MKHGIDREMDPTMMKNISPPGAFGKGRQVRIAKERERDAFVQKDKKRVTIYRKLIESQILIP